MPTWESGYDVFVFRRAAGATPWREVWRTMTFELPQPPALPLHAVD